jgi:PAS domain S-box-containing protein
MKPAPIPPDEIERLAALRGLGVLDSPPDPDFDKLTLLAAQICGTPLAMISLVDSDRQWFKSKVGVSNDEDPRELSFCAHALGSTDLLVVPDALADDRFVDNPLVTGEPNIRFYAGAPLVDARGHVLGTICVVDRQPRQLTPVQTQSLQTLSHQVMMLMQFYQQNREMQRTNASLLSILEDQAQVEKELRKSRESLRQKEALLRMVGRIAAIGGWSIKLPEYKVTWSEEMFAILGVTGDGQAPAFEEGMALFAPATRGRLEAAITECARTRKHFELEEQMSTFDHRKIWVRLTGEVEANDDGMVSAVRGALQNISARKRIEEQILTQHAQLTIAGRLAKVGAWSLTCESDECYWSDELCAIHGKLPGYKPTLNEAINFYVPEDRPVITRAVEACRQHGSPYEVELRITNAAGESIWVSTSGEAVRNDQGKIVKVQGALQDINAPKLAELEIIRSRETLIKILSMLQEMALGDITRDRLLKLVVKRVADLSGADGVSIDLLAGPELVCAATTGILDQFMGQRVPKEIKHWGEVLSAGEPLIWRADMPDKRVDTAAVVKSGVRAFLVVPLHDGRTRLGLLWVVAQKTEAFAESDFHNLEIVAESLSAAIQRIAAAEQLRRSEEQYRLLFVSNPLPMWTYDITNLRFLDVNNAAIQHYGYTREEFMGMTLMDIRAPQDTAEISSAIAKIKSAGFLTGLRMHQKKSGEIIEAEVSSEPVTFNGKTARLALAQDVTERRHNHHRLQEQAALIDAAPIAIIVQDMNNRIRFWSEGAVQLYGWSKAEAEGRRLLDLLKPDGETHDTACKRVVEQGEWSGEVTMIGKDKQSLTVAGRWKLRRNDNGKPDSILTIDIDITERKKLEQQFLQVQRLESIGTLAGGIAHDLNNLLTPITMGVQLLRLNEEKPESRAIIDSIELSARRGSNLVKQVLSFARGVDGARVAVHFKHVVQEIESIVANTFPKNIRLEVTIPSDLWLVMGDPTQLNQVLLNLCVNARDAIPMGGRIEISAANVTIDEQYAVMNRGMVPGRYVRIEVADTGTGMPPEIVDRIFDPFFTTKEQGRGTGLGLSTVQGIVRSHGGFVNVYSEPGKGSTFKIYFPAQEAGAVVTTNIRKTELPRGRGECILLVDDEASVLSVTRQTLETFGYRVMVAADGAEAISLYALHREEVAVVLTDMMMPVMDGPALIAALRRINPRVRLIAASGLSINSHMTQLSRSGVKHFLPKPFSAEMLLRMVREVIDAASTGHPFPGP